VTGVLLLSPVHAIASQEAPAKPVSEAIQRARALLDNGDGSAARILMDSLVAALPNASVDLVEALHWRAVLSESIGEAERDWKRLLVEAPLSSRAADALLRLAELEALRGSHQASRQHADRLVTEHASSVNKPRALLLIAKSWFAENNAGNACTALRELRGAATSVSGEIKLQSDELQPRCANVTRNAGTATPSKPATNGKSLPASDKGVTTDKPASATAAASDSATSTKTSAGETTRGQYSVQLAAYDRRSDADAMLKRLATMNIAARVEGSAAPYRVRTGRYATRAAAAEALAQLKKRGLNGFVAEPSRE
jgi:cell division septation protein DedD